VIAGVDAIKVVRSDGTVVCELPTVRFRADPDRDIAVAELSSTEIAWRFPAQEASPAGSLLWAGYPYADSGVLGSLAGKGEKAASPRMEIGGRPVPVWQLNGAPPIAGGMSGGPVV